MTLQSLTKRQTTPLSNCRAIWLSALAAAFLFPNAFLSAQQTHTTGWSSRRQTRQVNSTADSISSAGLHRGRLAWGTGAGHNRPTNGSPWSTNQSSYSPPAARTHTDSVSLRRSLQHHARSQSSPTSPVRTASHARNANTSPWNGSEVPASPWQSESGAKANDPFDDPFGDLNRPQRQPIFELSQRTETSPPQQVQPTTPETYRVAARSNVKPLATAIRLHSPVDSHGDDSEIQLAQQTEPPTESPEYSLPPKQPPFGDLLLPDDLPSIEELVPEQPDPILPQEDQPQRMPSEPRPAPAESTDLFEPAEAVPSRELPPPLTEQTPPGTTQPLDTPQESLESPFDPADTPQPPEMMPKSQFEPDDRIEDPGVDLETIEPFERSEDLQTPPEPDELPGMEDEFEQPDDSADTEDDMLPPPVDEFDATPRDLGPNLDLEDQLPPPSQLRPRPADDTDYEDDEEDDLDEDDEVPCDRKYDGRNCCREDRECVAVTDYLEGRKVRNISLDITPPFFIADGNADDVDPVALKAKKLAEAPSRDWKNRHGQVVATGRLTDIRNHRIIVETNEGALVPLPPIEMSRDDLCFLTAYWNLPAECPLPGDPYAIRDFTMLTYTWTASGLCHKPLYFQNIALERYGHSAGPIQQHLWSAAHFFGSALILPYSMGVYTPDECRYALGYYEPGDCAPWMIHAFPLSKRGALAELSVILGLWGIIQ